MSIYEELDVSPVLNAAGTLTVLGGNTPSAKVRSLMDESEEYYVHIGDLITSVGGKIANMLGVESATVTSGCASALTLAAAACMAGNDPSKIEQIPDITGMRHEFIIQKQLRVKYDRCLTLTGGKLVEVGDIQQTKPEHIESAIGTNTAAIHYLMVPQPGQLPGALPLEEVIQIGHSYGIPIIVDAASQVYPTDKLSQYVKMGADLVAYGAKYFGSVSSSGILTGRKDLVDSAMSQSFANFETSPLRTFGRPMKLDRQEIVAVYAALREWLSMNHEDRFDLYESRISNLRSELAGISCIEMSDYPDQGPKDGLKITINPSKTQKTKSEVIEELRSSNPSIWVRDWDEIESFIVTMPQLKEGGEKIIARRLGGILG